MRLDNAVDESDVDRGVGRLPVCDRVWRPPVDGGEDGRLGVDGVGVAGQDGGDGAVSTSNHFCSEGFWTFESGLFSL